MQLHANATTTPLTRQEIGLRVESGEPIQQVARDFGVSRTTARKWSRRWIEEGPRGLLDRRSSPRRIPHRTPRAAVRRIRRLRKRRWVAWQIARALQMAMSTVSAVLRRIGLGRLAALEPAPAPARRYERAYPGALLHVDTKKLGRFRDVGHRITGDYSRRTRGVGWEHAHVCVDDHTRLTYVEVLPDEQKTSAVAFLRRAIAWFREQGITPERVMTDNGPAYMSKDWKRACEELGIEHRRTRPYTPRTNGKAERFIQTLVRQWAYGRAYTTSRVRAEALPAWVRYYNDERPHRSLGMNPPRQRLRLHLEQRT